MDYVAILQRAFRITIKYRALWIFGFFLALCSPSVNISSNGGSSDSGGNQSGNGFDKGDFDIPFESIPMPDVDIWMIVMGIVAAVLCLIFILVVIGIIVRAVTRTALIGMVDQIEETEATTIRDGWRFGWSKRAWTVFLVSFIIIAPLIVIFGAWLLLSLVPLMLLFLENDVLLYSGIAVSSGLMLLWILAVIIVSIVASPFLELGWRYAALRQMDVVDSLKAAYALIRQNLQEVAITVLLLMGMIIVWFLISIILFIIVMLLGVVVGGIPSLIAFLITQSWWAAMLVGIVPFMIVVIVPLVFAKGLYLTLRSAVWTLTFRELTLARQAISETGGSSEAADDAEDTVLEDEEE
jgi:hypothetical protein